MRWVAAVLALVACLGCRPPEPRPLPQARLVVTFLDQDALLELTTRPVAGPWRLMNAGLWEPLPVRWREGVPDRGSAVVGRTAPDWVLLEDPSGEVHRVVMRGAGPEELATRYERMDPRDRDLVTLLGLWWVLAWSRP